MAHLMTTNLILTATFITKMDRNIRATSKKVRKMEKEHTHGTMDHTIKDFIKMIIEMDKVNIKHKMDLIGKVNGIMERGKD